VCYTAAAAAAVASAVIACTYCDGYQTHIPSGLPRIAIFTAVADDGCTF